MKAKIIAALCIVPILICTGCSQTSTTSQSVTNDSSPETQAAVNDTKETQTDDFGKDKGFFEDNPAPIYDNVEFRESSGTGAAMSYEDLQDFLDKDNMNFLRFEILDVYSPEDAYELTKNDIYLYVTTLFKAKLTYDYLNDKPLDIDVNIAQAGTAESQFENSPLYGVGEVYAAYFTNLDLNDVDIVATNELVFAIKKSGQDECALHRRFEYINFITADGRNIDMGIDGGQALVITTTRNNPVKYVHMYDIEELAEFFREDWTARGYKFSKL